MQAPTLLILAGLAGVGLVWVFRNLSQNNRKIWRRQFLVWGSVLLLIYFTPVLRPLVSLSTRVLVSFVPQDSGAAADAIVILGRGRVLQEARVETAANLWQAKRAPIIFVSGDGDAQPMVEALQARGLPKQVLDGENCSKTTEENARLTASRLLPRGVRRIVLVTDPPHMLRSLLTFNSLGFTATPSLSPFPSWYPTRQRAVLVFREYTGLVSYGVLGRFRNQRAPTLSS